MTSPYKEALDNMPDIVGTPGTGAYQRSLENLLRWYDRHYKAHRRALRIADALTREPSEEMIAAWENCNQFHDAGFLLRAYKAMVSQLLKEIEE